MRVLEFHSLAALVLAALGHSSPIEQHSKKPRSFLKEIGNATWVLGNDIWNVTQNRQYATRLWYGGKDRVGDAVGHYVSYNGAASNLNWTSAGIVDSGRDWINVKFTAVEGDFHWVVHDDLAGAYQYFVNHALPTLGEFRTLWRLDNVSFPRGRTNVKDDVLPPLAEYLSATKVQDETWQRADGTYLTKYDWAGFVRDMDFHGVYGDEVGSWYMNPGKDYFNGDHLKAELMVHRESLTGDAVQLNMLHGTHFQATSRDSFADGKLWGPWLWYLNDGCKDDAAARAKKEQDSWPYTWLDNAAYQSRGKIQGKLVLSDGRPAAGAAVFLGDNNNNASVSTLDQGQKYYYTTYADSNGKFAIHGIRTGRYALYAWSNGGAMADVLETFTLNDVMVEEGENTNLKELQWDVGSARKNSSGSSDSGSSSSSCSSDRIFQIGNLDRKTTGFHLSNTSHPFQHALISHCPANLTYTVGTSSVSDWCFGQSLNGTWSIVFPTPSSSSSCSYNYSQDAKLTLSLAGFSQGTSAEILLNGLPVGNITSAGLANSQDTYRGATLAGEWRLVQFVVPREGFKEEGEVNRLEFRVERAEVWRGWLWDAVLLEWIG